MKPHARAKAARRVLSPDEAWARTIRMRVIADCHPWQKDAVMDPHELLSARVGRGGAKTTTMRAREIIKLTTLREQRLGFAATSKDQARDLMWPQFKRACEAYELRTAVSNVNPKPPDLHILDAKLMATCVRTGSELVLRGVEDKRDAEKFRGFPQAEFDIDEAGSFPVELLRYLIEDCVQPRIGEAYNIRYLDDVGDQIEIVRGGCIFMGSTPPAQLAGLFYEATKPSGTAHRPYRERAERTAEWSSHNWTLEDVVALPDADKYPALQALWAKALERKAVKGWADDHPVWRREYLGEWSADFTTSVYMFSTEKNVWKPCGDQRVDGLKQLEMALEALPKDVGMFRHAVTLDGGGSRDPDACNAFSFAPADPQRRLFHTFCYEAPNRGVRPLAELLIGPDAVARVLRGEGHGKLGGIFGLLGTWPDGLEMDADDAIITELASVYGIMCRKADRRADYKFGAIEMVNGDLLGEKILVIYKSQLAEQLAGLQWKTDDHGRHKENPAQPNHSSDCLLYAHRLVSTLYDSGVVSHEVPARARDAFVDPMGLSAPPEAGDTDGEDNMLAPSEWTDEEW